MKTRCATLNILERLGRVFPLLAFAALLIFGVARLGRGEAARELPPPPPAIPTDAEISAALNAPPVPVARDAKEAAQAAKLPSVDVAVLQAPVGGKEPQEIWSDAAPQRADILPMADESAPALINPNPANPAGSAATAGDAQVRQMLDAVGQEAPRNATLESMLFTQLQAAMPQGSEGYIFERATMPDVPNLPPSGWKVNYDFKLPTRGIGPASFTANVMGANGKTLRRISGSVIIDREARGVQVGRVIHGGEALTPADFKVLGTRLSQLPRGAFDTTAKLIGTSAKQELRPGQWLTDQMLQVADVIKRGQAVTIRLAHGPIKITAPGITRQDGAMNEVIRVENAQSRREIYARITGRDEVQVIF